MFSMSLADLQKQVRDRVGQSVLTTAGSACYSGIDGEELQMLELVADGVVERYS